MKGTSRLEKWVWDVDEMSYIDFRKVVSFLLHKHFKYLWYQHPKFGLSCGLKPLNNDANVLQLGANCKGFGVVAGKRK